MSLKSKERGFMWNDFLLNGIGRRVGVLVFVALIGGKFLAHIFASNWWFCWFPVGTHEALAHVVAATPFTVPTFLALWWFRTYDARQQLQRANFEAGVGHIASDTPIRIEIGTQILREVSKVTSAFDIEIALTFVKRLKRYPAETAKNESIVTGGYRWGYAQHMLNWLLNDYKRRGKKQDLEHLDLRNQDFTNLDAESTAPEVLKMHTGDDFTVDVSGCADDVARFLGIHSNAYWEWYKGELKNQLERRQRIKFTEGTELYNNEVEISVANCQNKPPEYTAESQSVNSTVTPVVPQSFRKHPRQQ